MYAMQSGALLERMAKSGADIVSLDWTVTMEEGRRRIGEDMGVQGNLDPAVLYAPHDVIKVHTLSCIHSNVCHMRYHDRALRP